MSSEHDSSISMFVRRSDTVQKYFIFLFMRLIWHFFPRNIERILGQTHMKLCSLIPRIQYTNLSVLCPSCLDMWLQRSIIHKNLNHNIRMYACWAEILHWSRVCIRYLVPDDQLIWWDSCCAAEWHQRPHRVKYRKRSNSDMATLYTAGGKKEISSNTHTPIKRNKNNTLKLIHGGHGSC